MKDGLASFVVCSFVALLILAPSFSRNSNAIGSTNAAEHLIASHLIVVLLPFVVFIGAVVAAVLVIGRAVDGNPGALWGALLGALVWIAAPVYLHQRIAADAPAEIAKYLSGKASKSYPNLAEPKLPLFLDGPPFVSWIAVMGNVEAFGRPVGYWSDDAISTGRALDATSPVSGERCRNPEMGASMLRELALGNVDQCAETVRIDPNSHFLTLKVAQIFGNRVSFSFGDNDFKEIEVREFDRGRSKIVFSGGYYKQF
jgi:hypothetical protein